MIWRMLTAPLWLPVLLGGVALLALIGLGMLLGWALEGRSHA